MAESPSVAAAHQSTAVRDRMRRVYDLFLESITATSRRIPAATSQTGKTTMPHLTVEYSANLRNFGALSKLCKELATTLVDQRADGKPVFPVGGVRVRAIVAEYWCIGDGSIADAAFAHARLQIGAGRSEAVKKAAGDALFEVLKAHFAREYGSQGLALSLEISEFSESGTWKHNNLHTRYAAQRDDRAG